MIEQGREYIVNFPGDSPASSYLNGMRVVAEVVQPYKPGSVNITAKMSREGAKLYRRFLIETRSDASAPGKWNESRDLDWFYCTDEDLILPEEQQMQLV